MIISIVLAKFFHVLIFVYGTLYLYRSSLPTSASVRKQIIRLLIISLFGIACGVIQSLQNPPPYFFTDLLTLLTLAMVPGAAIGITRSRIPLALRLVIINVLTAASVFALISRVFSLESTFLGSFLRGNSTAVTYAVIYLGFFGITQIMAGRYRKQGIILASSGIITSAIALGKWSLPATAILAILLITSTNRQLGLAYRSKRRKLLIGILSVISLIFLTLTLGGGDRLAQRHGFEDFNSFLHSRIILEEAVTEVGHTGIYVSVRDGGRFEMWQDSIERTLESPWMGIGIGYRPLDVLGPNTHNVWVFLLASMGIPLFVLYCIQLFRLFALVFIRLPKDQRYRLAFWGWSFYVVFAFSVGASFDQAFNVLFAFLPFGFFATVTSPVRARLHGESPQSASRQLPPSVSPYGGESVRCLKLANSRQRYRKI